MPSVGTLTSHPPPVLAKEQQGEKSKWSIYKKAEDQHLTL